MRNTHTSLITILLFSLTHLLQAQNVPTGYFIDGVRFSSNNLAGSARMQAIGGSGVSLGGDISHALINPAGLGFNRRSEAHLGAGISFNKTDASGMGIAGEDQRAPFNIPFGGAVFSMAKGGSQTWKGGSFAITYSRMQDYNENIAYTGDATNQSSLIDFFFEQAQGLSLGFMNEDSPSQFGVTTMGSLGFHSDLLFPYNPNDLNNPFYYLVVGSSPLGREGYVKTEGNKNQISFAYGGNLGDTFYFGGTLGIESIRYTKDRSLFEFRDGRDLVGIELFEQFETDATGINGKIGFIYKPIEAFRIGFTATTPTYYNVRDYFRAELYTDYNNVFFNEQETLDFLFPNRDVDGNILDENGNFIIDDFTGEPIRVNPTPDQEGVIIDGAETVNHELLDTEYNLRTPYRLAGGVSGFIGKNGFLSFDVEYVAYDQIHLSNGSLVGPGFFEDVDFSGDNQVLEEEYRGVWNINAGGEWRVNDWRVRLGYAYYPDPLKEALRVFDEGRQFITGGIGYRKKSYYIDFTVVHETYTELFQPYVLDLDFQEVPEEFKSPLIEIDQRKFRTMLNAGFFF
ncbi:hypothetical protein [Algivirga pacifica]|uniref:Hemin receptor n=1 Tax=Algivirga pacifica TaxID=1162670 RepID=A0ABP9DKY5_9BACT